MVLREDKINEPLPRFIKSKRDKTQINKIGNEKGEVTTDNMLWIIEKARGFQKNIYFCITDYPKAFDYVDHNNLWKIVQGIFDTRPPDLPPEKSVCRPKSNS